MKIGSLVVCFHPFSFGFYNHKNLIVPSIFTIILLLFILAWAKSIWWAWTILWYFSFVVPKPNNGQLMGTPFFMPQYPQKFVCKFIVGDFFICGEIFEVQLFSFHPRLK